MTCAFRYPQPQVKVHCHGHPLKEKCEPPDSWSSWSLMITLFLAIPFVQNSRKHQEKKLSKKRCHGIHVLSLDIYLQPNRRPISPIPQHFDRTSTIAFSTMGFHPRRRTRPGPRHETPWISSGIFSTEKACWCMKSLGFEWYGHRYFLLKGEKSLDLLNCFSCSEKVTQEAGKLTSSVPYHEDRCLPPKLNPPPLINKAFPLNTSVLQTCCIFVQHLLLASQNGPTVYIPVVTK